MRIISILVTVAAMTSPSYAGEPPKISIESLGNAAATLEDSGVSVAMAGEQAIVTMRLGLVAASGSSQTARIALALPEQARIVGMELEQGPQHFSAESMVPRDAIGEFEEHKNWWADPALLEWQPDADGHRRLQLQVSPLTSRPSTVMLTLVIPHLQRDLVVDLAGWQRTIPRAAFAHATVEEAPIAQRPDAVTAERALYAGPIDPTATQDNIKRFVRAAYPQLRLCYDNSQAHDAVMHFTIANGHVHDFSIDGLPERAKGCVAEIADRWTFLEFENTIHVNYPLHFINLK
jgi:hypothetical protein